MKTIITGIAMAAVLTAGASLAQAAQSDQNAASGNNNQAVATTSANAATPAHGANSFTMSQARNRIESEGYKNVNDLTKDNNGVWHGKAQKNGTTTTVWLDYKGNVGQASD